MISSDDCTPGSSAKWLSERLSFRRLMSPQGMTDGREDRQLAERSSSVIWQEMSMSQSMSTQGSLRWDHFTRRAWAWETGEEHPWVVSVGQVSAWDKAVIDSRVSWRKSQMWGPHLGGGIEKVSYLLAWGRQSLHSSSYSLSSL